MAAAGREEGDVSPSEGGIGRPFPGTPYRLLTKLGSGASAVVYRAQDSRSGKRVAIKVMRYRRDSAPQLADRMRLEAEALGKLKHRNLTRLIDYGTAGGHLYLVLEEAPGRTLEEVLKERVEMSHEEAVFIASEVLSALSYVHKRGIVHRDVKPSNIMLGDDTSGRDVRLLDLGILKLLDTTVAVRPLQHPTDRGQRLGSARYTSPEQAEGGAVDGRADLYSLALVLYQMLVGRHPFSDCETTAELYRAHIKLPPPALPIGAGLVPATLAKVVMSALAKHRDDRPADAAIMARQLKVALSRGGAAGGVRTVLGLRRPAGLEGPMPKRAKDPPTARVVGGTVPGRTVPGRTVLGLQPPSKALERARALQDVPSARRSASSRETIKQVRPALLDAYIEDDSHLLSTPSVVAEEERPEPLASTEATTAEVAATPQRLSGEAVIPLQPAFDGWSFVVNAAAFALSTLLLLLLVRVLGGEY